MINLPILCYITLSLPPFHFLRQQQSIDFSLEAVNVYMCGVELCID